MIEILNPFKKWKPVKTQLAEKRKIHLLVEGEVVQVDFTYTDETTGKLYHVTGRCTQTEVTPL